jgi:biotin-(acetyl-CoA carboxylase) ligase
VERELDTYQKEGWTSYRPALSYLDCLLGQEIQLVSGGREFRGRAVGIDDHGALQLEDPRGRILSFSAGDVHLTAVQNLEEAETEPRHGEQGRRADESTGH